MNRISRLKPGQWLLTLALLGLLAATGAGLAQEPTAQEIVIAPGEPIVVAVLAAVRDGESAFGIASDNGALLAHEERAQLRFGDAHFAIQLDRYDSACGPEAGAAAAAQLIEEGRAVGVVGPNCSGACLATGPLFDEAGFTNLSPSCSGPVVAEQGFSSFHRLTNVNTVIAANSIRYLAAASGAGRLAILQHQGDPYYGSMAEAAAEAFADLGGEVVLDLALSDEWDAQQLYAEITKAEADFIYCSCNPVWASALLSLPGAPHRAMPFLGESHDWAHHLIARLGATADGVYFSSDYPYALPATSELAARYEARFGAAPYSPYFATAYDAYQLLLDAVLAVGALDEAGALRIDRAALNAEIRATTDYEGVTGAISCDEQGDCLLMPTAVLQIQDGEFVLLDVTLPDEEAE